MILVGLAIICLTSPRSARPPASPTRGATVVSCPFGILGVVMTLQIVMFAYQGVGFDRR